MAGVGNPLFFGGKFPGSGRKKGSKNKNTVAAMLKEEFPDYDPLKSLIKIAQLTSTPLDIRVNCHKEVAKYIHPQLKAVEHSGEMDVHQDTVMFVMPSEAVDTGTWTEMIQNARLEAEEE